MDVELKRIVSKVAGEIVYFIEGRNTYFSCLSSARPLLSSVHAAEQIVLEISAAEEYIWPMLFFHDVQTHRGYASRRKGTYTIERLELRAVDCQPVVERRIPVAQGAIAMALAAHGAAGRESGIQEAGELPGVPEHILDLFLPFIEK